MKKNILLTLLLLTVFFHQTLVYSYGETDIPSTWSVDTIEEMKAWNEFRSDAFCNYKGAISREDFIYIAVKVYELLDGEEIEVDTGFSFNDTTDIYALKGYSAGITSGISNGNFGPNETLTREQLATFMTRILTVLDFDMESAAVEQYNDHDDISDWARNSIYLAKSNNIMSGVGDNKVDPKGMASTEMVLVIANRVLKSYGYLEDTNQTGEDTWTIEETFNNKDYEEIVLGVRRDLLKEQISLLDLFNEYSNEDDELWNLIKVEINKVSEWYDYDKDDLLDYYEITRYLTNPSTDDTDNDGVKDSEASERNEYCYHIIAKVQIVKPFIIEDMETVKQTVELLEEDNKVGIFQVTLYPLAENILAETYTWNQYKDFTEHELAKYINAGLAFSYNEEMTESVTNLLYENGLDIDEISDYMLATNGFPVIERLLDLQYLDDGGVARMLPYDEDGIDMDIVKGNSSLTQRYDNDVNFLNLYGDKNLSFEEKLNLMAFGQVMFEERIIGNCTTTANIIASVNKSVGLPTRVAVTFPLFTSEDSILITDVITKEEVLIAFNHGDPVKKDTKITTPGPTSDHWYPEFYVGNRWVNFDSGDEALNVTIASLADYSEFDHYTSWDNNIEKNNEITDNLMLLEVKEYYPTKSESVIQKSDHIIAKKYMSVKDNDFSIEGIGKIDTFVFDGGQGDDYSLVNQFGNLNSDFFGIINNFEEDKHMVNGANIYILQDVSYSMLPRIIKSGVTQSEFDSIEIDSHLKIEFSENITVYIIK